MATARTGGLESTAIRSKQAEHLRKRVFLSPLFNIATAIIIVALLWPVAAHPQVLLWLGLVCMLNVGQLVLVRSRVDPRNDKAWMRWLTIAAVASGLMWGSVAVFVPAQIQEYPYFVLLMAGVVSVLALPSLAVVPGVFTLYLVGILIPVTARMVLTEQALQFGIALASLLLLAVVYLTGREVCRILTEAFRNELALEKLAKSDPLTRAANRRHFDEYLQSEWHFANRGKSALTLMLLDVDNFKHYNDSYGHARGDECLKRVADALQSALPRTTDLVARYGGEEFVAVLPFTDAEGGQLVAERLRCSVRELRIPHRGQSSSDRVSVSIGGATCLPRAHMTPLNLIESADRALYEAKRRGKDQIRWRNWGCHSIDPDQGKQTPPYSRPGRADELTVLSVADPALPSESESS